MAIVLKRINRIKKLVPVLAALGAPSLVRFGIHKYRLRTGFYVKSSPVGEWKDVSVPDVALIRNPFSQISIGEVQRAIADPNEAIAAGDRILQREVLYFSHYWKKVPPTWRENPFTNFETPSVHWSKVPDFDLNQGDVKWIWEPSRFDWVYGLARAYAASRDEKYVEGFWSLLDDWRLHNPPNTGVNWKCGQESSFKMFALAFAAGAFRDAKCSTPERMGKLWQTFRKLTDRVLIAIDYALSQRNNHGISEAVALYLAGKALPSEVGASQWATKGRTLFEQQIQDQFFTDGAYIQHSFIYERLAIRDALIFLYAEKSCGETCAPETIKRLQSASQFLAQVTDPASGFVPNYGANDGANIFALNGCGYLDFRPVVQAFAVVVSDSRYYDAGPWDEELAWLGLKPQKRAHAPAVLEAKKSGYFGLRGTNSFGLVRCHTFNTRPNHADMLALDLWVNGENVFPDAGTFQYYDPKDTGNYLKSTPAHSTIEVNGHSQMTKGSRFLWLDWTKSKLIRFDSAGNRFAGEHYGYSLNDGVVHRREIIVSGDEWLVVDDLLLSAGQTTQFALRWRLNQGGHWNSKDLVAYSDRFNLRVSVACSVPMSGGLIPGNLDNLETVASLFYGEVVPIDLLKFTTESATSFRWITTVGNTPLAVDGNDNYTWNGFRIAKSAGTPIETA